MHRTAMVAPPNSTCLCCMEHASTRPTTTLNGTTVVELTRGNAVLLVAKLANFAPTQALDAVLEHHHRNNATTTTTAVSISVLKLCKLHERGSCKLEAKCRNIHLCRELIPQVVVQQQTAIPLSARAALKHQPQPIPALSTTNKQLLPPIRCASPMSTLRTRLRSTADATAFSIFASRSSIPEGLPDIALRAVMVPPRSEPKQQPPASSTTTVSPVLVADEQSDESSILEAASEQRMTPAPPSAARPPRSNSPTQSCLSKFVRRWHQPLLHSSGGSSANHRSRSSAAAAANKEQGMAVRQSSSLPLFLAALRDSQPQLSSLPRNADEVLMLEDSVIVSEPSPIPPPPPPPQQQQARCRPCPPSSGSSAAVATRTSFVREAASVHPGFFAVCSN
jgi:hypothetical protein